jgi:hypothetical protein
MLLRDCAIALHLFALSHCNLRAATHEAIDQLARWCRT